LLFFAFDYGWLFAATALHCCLISAIAAFMLAIAIMLLFRFRLFHFFLSLFSRPFILFSLGLAPDAAFRRLLPQRKMPGFATLFRLPPPSRRSAMHIDASSRHARFRHIFAC